MKAKFVNENILSPKSEEEILSILPNIEKKWEDDIILDTIVYHENSPKPYRVIVHKRWQYEEPNIALYKIERNKHDKLKWEFTSGVSIKDYEKFKNDQFSTSYYFRNYFNNWDEVVEEINNKTDYKIEDK